MARILSLETSTTVCSVAIYDQEKLISNQQLFIARSHAELILTMVAQVLKNCHYTLKEMDAIAIAGGPGSYTGLRISVATAKGLCYSSDLPLIAINTLAALVETVKPFNKVLPALYCPMLDARRNEVYCMIVNDKGEILLPTCAHVITDASFANFLDNNAILFFGDGAAKCKSIIMHQNAYFLDNIYPSAIGVGKLAYTAFQKAQFVPLASFEPYYLKGFQGNPINCVH